MTALQKLKLAASVIAFGTPTTVAGTVEYESHPATGILCGILLAGAASVVALANAYGAADELGRQRVAEQEPAPVVDDMPPSARTPLFEVPPAGGLEAQFAAGAAYVQQLYGATLPTPVPVEDAPTTVTQVDMAPVETTHEMVATPTEPWTPPVAPDAPWSDLGREFTRIAEGPVRPGRHAGQPDDLYAHPVQTAPVAAAEAVPPPPTGAVTIDWFRKPSVPQGPAAVPAWETWPWQAAA